MVDNFPPSVFKATIREEGSSKPSFVGAIIGYKLTILNIIDYIKTGINFPCRTSHNAHNKRASH